TARASTSAGSRPSASPPDPPALPCPVHSRTRTDPRSPAMLRSLFSGISGLQAHQTKMDVVGNNIANVNTVGFKSSTTVFEDTLSQLLRNGSAPQNRIRGTNPR